MKGIRLTITENAPVRALRARHDREIAQFQSEVRDLRLQRDLWHADDIVIAIAGLRHSLGQDTQQTLGLK